MTNYTLRNDFHRTECTIRSRETHPISDYVEIVLTDYQTRRLKRELCGMADCWCSGDVGTRGRQFSDDGKPISVIAHDSADLINYSTGDIVRPATADELRESIDAAKIDGGAGVIDVDGRSCYVSE